MKKLLFLCSYAILVSISILGQETITFLDAETKKPIFEVRVYDKKGELLTLSNLDGEVFLSDSTSPMFRAKHLEYLNQEFDIRRTKVIYLKSRFQNLDEVVAVPFQSKSFYDILIEKTKAKLPKVDFYGTFSYSSDVFRVLSDTTKKMDTVYSQMKCQFAFQYQFSKNKKKRKILFYPISASKIVFTNYRALYQHVTPISLHSEGFFKGDLMDMNEFENYTKKDRYHFFQHTDSLSYIQISQQKENEFKGAKLSYNEADSTLINFRKDLNGIKNNTTWYTITESISYDTINELYFIKTVNFEYFHQTFGERVQVIMENIHLGQDPNFNEETAVDFHHFLKNLPAEKKGYQTGLLAKRYYLLFKH